MVDRHGQANVILDFRLNNLMMMTITVCVFAPCRQLVTRYCEMVIDLREITSRNGRCHTNARVCPRTNYPPFSKQVTGNKMNHSLHASLLTLDRTKCLYIILFLSWQNEMSIHHSLFLLTERNVYTTLFFVLCRASNSLSRRVEKNATIKKHETEERRIYEKERTWIFVCSQTEGWAWVMKLVSMSWVALIPHNWPELCLHMLENTPAAFSREIHILQARSVDMAT